MDLAKLDLTELSKTDSKDLLAVTTASAFLPRLQVCGGNSKLAKSGKIPVGRLALITSKESFIDLGNEVEAIAVVGRPKALDTSSDELISVYDRNHSEFKRIQTQSSVKDSGCMFGLELLVWIPSQNRFATLFYGTISMRIEGSQTLALMMDNPERTVQPTGLILKSKFVEGKKHSWHVVTAVKNSSPMAPLPNEEALMEEVKKFLNPPALDKEKVEDDNDRER